MSTTIIKTAGVERETALDRARAFFDRNPDEVLTRQDLQIKLECCPRTAHSVAKALIREGVRRDQLPRNRPAPPVRKVAGSFPGNLTPAEERAIYGFHRYGSIASAAAAAELTYVTVQSYLKNARKKAGVHTTADLVDRFLAAVDDEEGGS